MMALLETYSITEILIFLVLLAIAFKSVVTFWDWLVGRLSVHFKKESEQALQQEKTEKKFEEIDEKFKQLQEKQQKCDCQSENRKE